MIFEGIWKFIGKNDGFTKFFSLILLAMAIGSQMRMSTFVLLGDRFQTLKIIIVFMG